MSNEQCAMCNVQCAMCNVLSSLRLLSTKHSPEVQNMIDKKSLALGMALGRWNLLKTGGVGLYAARGISLRHFCRRQASGAASGSVGPAVLTAAEGWMFTGQPTSREASAFVQVAPAVTLLLTATAPQSSGVSQRSAAAAGAVTRTGTAETVRSRMESDTYA